MLRVDNVWGSGQDERKSDDRGPKSLEDQESAVTSLQCRMFSVIGARGPPVNCSL